MTQTSKQSTDSNAHAVEETLVNKNLEEQLRLINQHKTVKAHNSYFKLFLLQFYKGTAFGLGSVLGATLVLSVAFYFLSKIEFIPIVGEWVTALMSEIQLAKDK